MRGRDVIVIFTVILLIGALSAVGFWFGSGGSAVMEARSDAETAPEEVVVSSVPAAARVNADAPNTPSLGSDAAVDAGALGAPPAAGAAAADGLTRLGALEGDVSGPGQGALGAPENPDVAATIDRDSARVDVNDPDSFPSEPGRGFINLDTNRPDGDVGLRETDTALLGAPPDQTDVAPGGEEFAVLRETPEDPLRSVAANPDQASITQPLEAPRGIVSDEVTERPTFDLVRVAQDGSAVLAGRAQPGSFVSVLVDGVVAEEVTADPSGSFVALIAAPEPGALSRRFDLRELTPEGVTTESLAPVIVTMPSDPGAPPVALRPSESGGVELLQPAADTPEGRVTIDAVTYGEEGEVFVSGRGAPGETTRVYLDNALAAEVRVNPDGDWRARLLREIAPAVYTLRVDQMTTEGIVTSRAETPFERAPVEDIVLQRGQVVVQPGNNLWRIAAYVYGSGQRYVVIYGANRDQIRDPDLIYPGQILDLPEETAAN